MIWIVIIIVIYARGCLDYLGALNLGLIAYQIGTILDILDNNSLIVIIVINVLIEGNWECNLVTRDNCGVISDNCQLSFRCCILLCSLDGGDCEGLVSGESVVIFWIAFRNVWLNCTVWWSGCFSAWTVRNDCGYNLNGDHLVHSCLISLIDWEIIWSQICWGKV